MITFCINLPDRKDRWERVQNEFPKLGLNVLKVDAIRRLNGHEGCIESHRKCLIEAAKYYEFLVVEDDVKIIGDLKQFNRAYDQLPEDYDCLYLGATLTRDLEKYSKNLFQLKGGLTTHAILYNNQNGVVDYIIENIRGPFIDEFMFEVQELFNCYIAYPMIATQDEGYSDIVNRVVDYKVITETYKRHTE